MINVSIKKITMSTSKRKFQKQHGFTLTEVLITVAIVGILTSIAYPAYTDHVARSNRVEAQRELIRAANLQEQFFIDHRQYTGNLSELGLGNSSTFITDNKNYKLKVRNFDVNAGTFDLRATAQGSQATNDKDCKWMAISNTGKKTAKSADCWE